MSDGFLSQEEIDSLLNVGEDNNGEGEPEVEEVVLSELDKDLLGEIGNISMGSASTALSQILNQPVNITTPIVGVTTIGELKNNFDVPNILLEVEYTSGIVGKNILIMKIPDAAVIANLMMGGNGEATATELSEIEISAVQEAMNQMIGSAATSMATMFAREVNISPPNSRTWNTLSEPIADDLRDEEAIISVSFNLNIGDLVDSNIMQILPIKTGRRIISIMMGEDTESNESDSVASVSENEPIAPIENTYVEPKPIVNELVSTYEESVRVEPPRQPVEVHNVKFESLEQNTNVSGYNNIDLIMDVPLEVSVLLGRTKKSIKDILNLGVGSLIELDKLADEPVEILVNGKMIAYGEVVVVDENFGVRITSIVSGKERLNSLK
ncbi:flagellar motor switch phosphatase FliY [Clostridium massiliamazoniense]|uniref:flagellar motor switch phosphatase FliY n=1 Tax=Clostridium massiliamazoniense TaxID=1347366 RepID=UPI0006D800B8|nr:flagellar motor switch phosphatase FliY [Clostridium massiliamazoniense]